MKVFTKYTLFFILFIIFFIYTLKSSLDLNGLIKKYKKVYPEYTLLYKQNSKLSSRVKMLSDKVKGIREKTINESVLEERAKFMLNYKKPYEIVISE